MAIQKEENHQSHPVKIKICGLTRPEEAEYLEKNRVDYAGIVMFYARSKRNTEPGQAEKILAALQGEIKKVAVTVTPTAEEIRQIQRMGFDCIQIHGAISEEMLSAIELPVFKAFNVKDMDTYDEYRVLPQVAGYVFDAAVPGSGERFDWKLAEQIRRDEKPLFLAGGLSAENVREAIETVRPDGVDVSSGVEYKERPGKDPVRIDAFVRCVRQSCLL